MAANGFFPLLPEWSSDEMKGYRKKAANGFTVPQKKREKDP
jgi:hypothetical protein